jgi:hypothetical protein
MAQATSQYMSDEMRQCIQNCLDCHSICLQTVVHCLPPNGWHGSVSYFMLADLF